MDVREKLVELIFMAHHNASCVIGYEGSDEEALEEEVRYLIANGVTVQEWVSVEDRLPKPFENVIVFRDGKISIDYNEGNGWFAYDFNGKRVTHWMPLPSTEGLE